MGKLIELTQERINRHSARKSWGGSMGPSEYFEIPLNVEDSKMNIALNWLYEQFRIFRNKGIYQRLTPELIAAYPIYKKLNQK